LPSCRTHWWWWCPVAAGLLLGHHGWLTTAD
jgi:hypothetical protein